jgi:hypothetical protein
MRAGVAALALLLLSPLAAAAEWQVRPFIGITFGGGTTLVDLAGAAGTPNVVYGVNGAVLGDIIGVEGDLGYAPGFFQAGGEPLVRQNSATTLTGNLVVSVPRHLTKYTLGPYFVAGGGFAHASIEDLFGVFAVTTTLPVFDIGGGATAYLSDRFGLMWDARYFKSVRGGQLRGVSIAPQDAREQISFWRASMGLIIR